jgi:hypothetical protein
MRYHAIEMLYSVPQQLLKYLYLSERNAGVLWCHFGDGEDLYCSRLPSECSKPLNVRS